MKTIPTVVDKLPSMGITTSQEIRRLIDMMYADLEKEYVFEERLKNRLEMERKEYSSCSNSVQIGLYLTNLQIYRLHTDIKLLWSEYYTRLHEEWKVRHDVV